MMRIAIVQLIQESNTFNPARIGVEEFARFGIGIGPEVIQRFADVDEIGGFLEGLRTWDAVVEPVGILRAQGWPRGRLSRAAVAEFSHILRAQLTAAGPLDGILFAVHGALVGEEDDDLDGYFLSLVRDLVGPAVPLIATIDLHAYVTRRMCVTADVLVAYHTAPHLDRRQTGVRAAGVLWCLLQGAQPVTALVRLPMISIAEAQDSFSPVLAPIYDLVQQLETRPAVLSAALVMTQAWLDVPELGWAAFVSTDGDAPLASRLAHAVAEMAWERRAQMTAEFLPPAACVEKALAIPGQPVVIADGADATNSGAGGDSTHLLRTLIDRPIPGGALTIMVDPAAVAHAQAVGEGGIFAFPVGGKRDNIFSSPLPVNGHVVALRHAAYILNGHLGVNLPVEMGAAAIVQIRDVTLLLVEYAGPGGTPMMYRSVGLEPTDYKIVIVKSPAGFRAEFAPFAAGILLSDCPGYASPRLTELPYHRITRPLWPFDALTDWRAAPWAGEFLHIAHPGKESITP